MKPLVIGLVGATASGKTALSLALCGRLQGEIICMDSMQVYQCMDIGTAKPTAAERALFPHHMLDVVSPQEEYSVQMYAQQARACIDAIVARGHQPILVGGTGLYLRALSQPLDFGFVAGDERIRGEYQAYAAQNGNAALHALLEDIDPVTAARLHANDTRRVIRALEVFRLTGRRFSQQEMPGDDDAPYRFLLYALSWPRETLYERINARVDDMLAQGLLDEVKALRDSGVSRGAQSMQGLGYKELYAHLEGECTLADASALVKQRTRNYAKRQLTWFTHDARVQFMEHDDTERLLEIIMKDVLSLDH